VQIARGRQPRAIRLRPNTTFWAPARVGVGNLRAATGGSRNYRPANSPAGRSRAAVSRARSVYRPTFRTPATRRAGRPATRGRSSRATNFQAGRSRAAVSRARSVYVPMAMLHFGRQQGWVSVICARQPGGYRNYRPANSPAGRSRAAVSRARSVYEPTFRTPATRRVGRPATRGRCSRATNFQAGRSRAAVSRARFSRGEFFGGAHFLDLGSQSFLPLDQPPANYVNQTRTTSPYGLGPIKPSTALVWRGAVTACKS